MVVKIEPGGRYNPLYQREHYRQDATRWHKVQRFESNELIHWQASKELAMSERLAVNGGTPVLDDSRKVKWPIITQEDKDACCACSTRG